MGRRSGGVRYAQGVPSRGTFSPPPPPRLLLLLAPPPILLGPPSPWDSPRRAMLLKASLEMLAGLLLRSVGFTRGARSREVHKLVRDALNDCRSLFELLGRAAVP